MNRILLISNGHGEITIAARLAQELQAQRPMICDHLALVGDFRYPSTMREVGPRRALPSGGVVAMGNLRNIARDVRAGLIAHTIAQLRFVRQTRGRYDAVIAVGDVFALFVALQTRARTIAFVGTAKSVYVAPYGAFERRLMRRAGLVFVRDEATALSLTQRGLTAAAANVIADLYTGDDQRIDVPFDPRIALFPGSRQSAYEDAGMLVEVMRLIAAAQPRAGAIISIAPGLDAKRMCARFEADGWNVVRHADARQPFSLSVAGREVVRAWSGSLSAVLRDCCIVLGQAGTANEAAAAHGIPVVACAQSQARRTPWYRMRQIALLGESMLVASADPQQASQEILALLNDPVRRRRMGAVGRERMGAPGAATRIARQIAASVNAP